MVQRIAVERLGFGSDETTLLKVEGKYAEKRGVSKSKRKDGFREGKTRSQVGSELNVSETNVGSSCSAYALSRSRPPEWNKEGFPKRTC
jgi:hypothetical protein